MAFVEDRFPTKLGRGSGGGPEWDVLVVENDAGLEERSLRHDSPRHVYSIDLSNFLHPVVYEVKRFHYSRRGATVGFRFKDWNDYASTATGSTHRKGDSAVSALDQVLGTGDGVETEFELVKEYEHGGVVETRRVKKPVLGTVRVAVDGVELAASAFTVNEATGLVTLATAPASEEDVTAGFEFDVPVRFGAGTNLDMRHRSRDTEDLSVELVELRDPAANPSEPFRGGSKEHGLVSANVSISLSQGMVHVVEPSTSGLEVSLPARSEVEPGAPLFFIVNESGANSLDLVDDEGTTLVTIPASGTVEVLLSEGSGGLRTWRAF